MILFVGTTNEGFITQQNPETLAMGYGGLNLGIHNSGQPRLGLTFLILCVIPNMVPYHLSKKIPSWYSKGDQKPPKAAFKKLPHSHEEKHVLLFRKSALKGVFQTKTCYYTRHVTI